jgi:hypothetical protein
MVASNWPLIDSWLNDFVDGVPRRELTRRFSAVKRTLPDSPPIQQGFPLTGPNRAGETLESRGSQAGGRSAKASLHSSVFIRLSALTGVLLDHSIAWMANTGL